MRMLTLTDYRTGKPVIVRADCIACVAPIEASVFDIGGDIGIVEHGERTRVDIVGGYSVIVRESSEEIAKMIRG